MLGRSVKTTDGNTSTIDERTISSAQNALPETSAHASRFKVVVTPRQRRSRLCSQDRSDVLSLLRRGGPCLQETVVNPVAVAIRVTARGEHSR